MQAGFVALACDNLVNSAGYCVVTTPPIAIIDDNEALCASLIDLMRSVGYPACSFASAEAFLESRYMLNVRCIIADIHMRGMGGLNLLRELNELGVPTPVILITAVPDKRLDEEAIALGAKCLLRKPFETQILLERVQDCLR
jgi:FixJ family two-component response regulator